MALVAAHARSLGVLSELREEQEEHRKLLLRPQKSPRMWDLRGQREAARLAGPCICYKLLTKITED